MNQAPVTHSSYKSYAGGSILQMTLWGYVLPPASVMTWVQRRWPTWREWIVRRATPERLYVLLRVIALLYGEEWARARSAVRQTAVTPGLADKKAWGRIGSKLGEQPGVGENVFRHLCAVDYYGATPHKHAEVRNACLELAWLALKRRHH